MGGALTIENAAMRVSLLPDYGARVTSLVDKSNGRDWIDQGGQSRNVGEDAVYGRAEAVGWDECFPTISPWDAGMTMWKRPLRDHGDLWGRPWSVDQHSPTAVATSYATAEFNFARSLTLDGTHLRVGYRVDNRTREDMPYLWALHGLLAVSPADRIVPPGVDHVAATYLALNGKMLDAPTLNWPDTNDVLSFPLDSVQPASRSFAGKFYVGNMASHVAAVGHDDQWLLVGWDGQIDAIGLWFNYGAWPEPPGTHHIALEPTSAPVDHLGQALDAGLAAWLKPGETRAWTITMTLAKDAP